MLNNDENLEDVGASRQCDGQKKRKRGKRGGETNENEVVMPAEASTEDAECDIDIQGSVDDEGRVWHPLGIDTLN